MSDAIQTIGIRFQFGGQLCLEGWARAGVSITPFWRFNPLEWVMHGWHIGHDPGPRSFCSVPLYSYLLSSLCVTFSPQKESHTKERRSVGFNAPSKLQSGPAGLYTSFCWHKNKSSITLQGDTAPSVLYSVDYKLKVAFSVRSLYCDGTFVLMSTEYRTRGAVSPCIAS